MSELKKDYVTICEYCGNEIKSLRRGKRFCDGSCRVNMCLKLKRDKAVKEAVQEVEKKQIEVVKEAVQEVEKKQIEVVKEAVQEATETLKAKVDRLQAESDRLLSEVRTLFTKFKSCKKGILGKVDYDTPEFKEFEKLLNENCQKTILNGVERYGFKLK